MSAESVDHIARNWSTGQDTCHDHAVDYVPNWDWPCSIEACADYRVTPKKRSLPDDIKAEAQKYVLTILSRYPFQLWPELSLPMIHRFLDVWNDTGDRRKAMRAI